ncbi:MAG: transporter substrate-binding domain-containing protein [Desulfovibrionaceae bacterium]|nr:transporter substrate-binding domain-containing protein [Desulfovibrionaceae bacterium]
MLTNLPFFRRMLPALAVLGALLVACAWTAPACASDYPEWQKPLRCVFGMPYIGRSVKPCETGMITEVLKEVFEQADVEFEHRNMPFLNTRQALKKGTIDCTLALDDAHETTIRGTAAIALYDLAVAHRIENEFEGVEDLKGQRVACIYGFDLQRLVPVDMLVQTAYHRVSVFQLLDRGHVKYVLDEESLLEEALLAAKLPTPEFDIARIKTLKVRVIFAPTEKGRRFQALYDSRMKEVAASGRMRAILRDNGMREVNIDRLLKANGQ